MKIGIMQPYFFPYLGYWQLMNAVDKFVIYDNIEYTKKGWFNRNCYLCEGERHYFTVPVEKASDFLDVRERRVSENFDREKLKRQIFMAYKKAPYFSEAYPVFCECADYQNRNLFEYIFYSVKKVCEYLEIQTEIIVSSSTGIGRELKSSEKILAICKKMGGDIYINPIGGQALYHRREFEEKGISLKFIGMDSDISYLQFENKFEADLSIIDVMMFNSREKIHHMLDKFFLC